MVEFAAININLEHLMSRDTYSKQYELNRGVLLTSSSLTIPTDDDDDLDYFCDLILTPLKAENAGTM